MYHPFFNSPTSPAGLDCVLFCNLRLSVGMARGWDESPTVVIFKESLELEGLSGPKACMFL